MALKRKATKTVGRRRSSRIAERGRQPRGTPSEPEFVDLESPTQSRPQPRPDCRPQSRPQSRRQSRRQSPPPSTTPSPPQSPPESPAQSPSSPDYTTENSDSESSAASEVEPANTIHFRSLKEETDFNENFSKTIAKGRAFNWAYLERINFKYLERLRKWRWRKFLTMNRLVYKNLPKYFYFNGRLEQHDHHNHPIEDTAEIDGFHTYLQGRHLRITHDEVHTALGKPRHKPNAPKYEPKKYDPLEGAKLIWGNDKLKCVPTGVDGVDVHNRILHLMVCRTINPRSGSHGKMTEEDIWYMEQIIREKPPNLAAVVMKRLKEGIRLVKSTRGLYYGRVISEIIDRFEIPGPKDGTMDNRTPVPFSEKTIKMTGFVQNKVTGEWTKTARNRGGKTGDKTSEDLAMEKAVMAVPDDDEEEMDYVNHVNNVGAAEEDKEVGEDGDEAGKRNGEEENGAGGSEGDKVGAEQQTCPGGGRGGGNEGFPDAEMSDAFGEQGVQDGGPTYSATTIVNAELQVVKDEVKGLRRQVFLELQTLKREQQQMCAAILEALRGNHGAAGNPVHHHPTPMPGTRDGQN